MCSDRLSDRTNNGQSHWVRAQKNWPSNFSWLDCDLYSAAIRFRNPLNTKPKQAATDELYRHLATPSTGVSARVRADSASPTHTAPTVDRNRDGRCRMSLNIKGGAATRNGTATSGPKVRIFPSPRPLWEPKPGWEDRIPVELRERDQWVGWRHEVDDARDKWTKIPYSAYDPDKKASTADPQTWDTFATVLKMYTGLRRNAWNWDGIGYVFSGDDPFAGFDFDNSVGSDGQILPWAKPYYDQLQPTPTEFSPSGNGVKGFVHAELPGAGMRRSGLGPDGTGAIEIYDRGRFFTVTGDLVGHEGMPIANRTDAITALYREFKPAVAPRTPQGSDSSQPYGTDEELLSKARSAINGAKFSALYDRGETPDRCSPSEADFRLVCMLAFWFNRNVEAIDRTFRESRLYRDKWDSPRSDSTYGQYTIDNALATVDDVYSPPRRAVDLPKILVSPLEHEAIDAAVDVLADDPAVFQRGNALVTVQRDTAKVRGFNRPVGSPRIAFLTNPRVRDLLTRLASIVKFRKDEDGELVEVPAHPPDWLAPGVVARGTWPRIRHIEAIAEAPQLRPDGSILDVPGYDDATGLLYEPNAEFPPIPDRPSKDQAIRATRDLIELVVDFPFATDNDRAAWLAALLTPLARPAIAGPCPLFMFDATTPGSGKTLLCDLIAILNTGRPMARTAYPDSDEEMRKRITSIALAGDRLMLLDNIATTFGGSALDAALTGLTWRDRNLGRLEMTPELPLVTTWFASGNNVLLKGDAVRRVIPCRLEAKQERPEERTGFHHPRLIAWAQEHRPRLVVAAMTILRAYIVAGRPDMELTPFGGYEPWSDVVRNAVAWAFDYDPCGTRQDLIESDPETMTRAALVEGWVQLPGSDKGLTAAQALEYVEATPTAFGTLRGALIEMSLSRVGDLPTSRQLGQKLKTIKGRIVKGMYLSSTPYQGTQKWKIEKVKAI